MKKTIALSISIILCVLAYSQSSTLSYFEVYTKLAHTRPAAGFSLNKDSILAKINGIPDTSATIATFVVSVEDPGTVDSVFYTLTNSSAEQVYSAAFKISNLGSNSAFKVNGKTLYFTVGPYPYLKRFTATAKVRYTNGQSSAIKSFAKN